MVDVIDIYFLLADKNLQQVKSFPIEHLLEYDSVDSEKNKITINTNKTNIFKILLKDETVQEIIIDIYLNGIFVKTMLFTNMKFFEDFKLFQFNIHNQNISFVQRLQYAPLSGRRFQIEMAKHVLFFKKQNRIFLVWRVFN